MNESQDRGIKISAQRSQVDGKVAVMVTFDTYFHDAIQSSLLDEVVRKVADRYIEENWPEIVARVNQNAIVNLALAKMATKIAEVLK